MIVDNDLSLVIFLIGTILVWLGMWILLGFVTAMIILGVALMLFGLFIS